MYELVSATMFLILFGIWIKSSLFNTILKIAFLVLFLFGFFEAMVEFGYIVHLGAMQ